MPMINMTLDAIEIIVTSIVLYSLISDSTYVKERFRCFTHMAMLLLVLLVTDLVGWAMLGDENKIVLSYIVNTANYMSAFMLIASYTVFLYNYLGRRKVFRSWIYVSHILMALCCVFMLVNIPTGFIFRMDDAANFVHGNLYWLSQAMGSLVLFIDAVIIISAKQIKSEERYILAVYPLLPLIFTVLDIRLFDFNLQYTCTFISVMLLYIRLYMTKANEIAKQQLEINKAQTAMMISQIQPHFLYNTITSIMVLCMQSPDDAVQSLADFADYLRGNLESITNNEMTPFETELKHTEAYLRLEKIRFHERLNIEYDIQTKDFYVPTLVLQPIVENAVKHGVTQCPQGGTVKISSCRIKNDVIITVEDDGVGFDTSAEPQDKTRQHIGISNVRSRIETMCMGTLTVDSTINVGTVATICIPFKGKAE